MRASQGGGTCASASRPSRIASILFARLPARSGASPDRNAASARRCAACTATVPTSASAVPAASSGARPARNLQPQAAGLIHCRSQVAVTCRPNLLLDRCSHGKVCRLGMSWGSKAQAPPQHGSKAAGLMCRLLQDAAQVHCIGLRSDRAHPVAFSRTSPTRPVITPWQRKLCREGGPRMHPPRTSQASAAGTGVVRATVAAAAAASLFSSRRTSSAGSLLCSRCRRCQHLRPCSSHRHALSLPGELSQGAQASAGEAAGHMQMPHLGRMATKSKQQQSQWWQACAPWMFACKTPCMRTDQAGSLHT